MKNKTIYTIGYGRFPTKQRIPELLEKLSSAKIELLVDIRHSPCPSQLDPASNYGPRAWNLQLDNGGLPRSLSEKNIAYLWLVELGNPQKNDPEMAILWQHIESEDLKWPVNRGLQLLKDELEKWNNICLLCACKNSNKCHRSIIADALKKHTPSLEIHHL